MDYLLITLIYTYWCLATVSVLVTLLDPPFIPAAFKDAVRLSAARGKLWSNKTSLSIKSIDSNSPSSLLGFMQRASVPQSWFLHFYALGAGFNLSLLTLTLLSISSSPHEQHQTPHHTESRGHINLIMSLLPLILFEVHLVRRLLETWLLMKYPRGARMHLLAYLFGLSYYLMVPLTLSGREGHRSILAFLSSASVSGEGSVNATARDLLLHLGEILAEALRRNKPLLLAGITLFLLANLLQLWSHHLLSLLSRPTPSRGSKDSKYQVPRGGLPRGGIEYQLPRGGPFELVTCPHYLAEILLYLALTLVCTSIDLQELAIGSLLMLAWVVVNLVLAASATQKWYEMELREELKKTRGLKRLIPYIW